MANLITDNFDYTYDGQISEEIFYAPSIQTPEITQLFRVLTGVNYKRQLTLTNSLSKIVKADAGCNVSSSGSFVLDNRTLEVCDMYFRVEQCFSEFSANWLVEKLPEGMNKAELGSFITTIAETEVLDALRRDNFRILSFGDTDAGSADYSQCDGLWKRLIAGEATYDVEKIDAITVLNQTDGTRALDYLRNIYNGSKTVLKQVPANQKIILVTGNVYENLMTTYEDKALDGGGLTARVEEGVTQLMFRGIDVSPVYAWDSALTDVDNPFAATFDTAILYTEKNNHVVGLQQANNLQQVQQWYEKKDRLVYWDGSYKMGYNFVHGDLTSISYGVLA